ncbi:MAG: nitroreductase family protein [bacterium]
MSELINLIKNRRSIRKFQEKSVERDKILTCIEAARFAPSAENKQPWRFLILDDIKVKQQFCKAVFSGIYAATRWAKKAPVIIVIIADLDFIAHRIGGRLQKVPFYFIDIGIAGEHFILQAQDLGLGTCWIGWFNIKKAQKILNLPKGKKVCQLIAMGYPDQKKGIRKKVKKTEQIVFYNYWGNNDQNK